MVLVFIVPFGLLIIYLMYAIPYYMRKLFRDIIYSHCVFNAEQREDANLLYDVVSTLVGWIRK